LLKLGIINEIPLDALAVDDAPDALPPSAPHRDMPMFDLFYRARGITEPETQEKTFISFAEAFEHYGGCVLLLGEPGAGKTTTLLMYARDAITTRLSDPEKPLPILGLVSSWDSQAQTPLAAWLAAGYADLNASTISQLIESGRAMLLLDGLDELGSERPIDPNKPDGAKYDPRLRFVHMMAESLSGNGDVPQSSRTSVLVTCRAQDYQTIGAKLPLNGAVTLKPLDDLQIEAYLDEQPELRALLDSDAKLREMLRTPLLLSIFGFAYREMTPEKRTRLAKLETAGDLRDELFQTYITERYAHEERQRGRLAFSREELVEKLRRLAYNNLFVLERYGEDNVLKANDLRRELHESEVVTLTELTIALHLFLAGEDDTLSFIHLLLRDSLAYQHAFTRLDDSDPDVRQAAARALGYLGDIRATIPLISALKDAHGDVRAEVAMALGDLGDNRAIQPLLITLSDSYAPVRTDAATALGMLGRSAVRPLIEALQNTNAYIREGAAWALGDLGDTLAVEPLLKVLRDANVLVRAYAARGLGTLGDKQAIQYLMPLLFDVDVIVRAWTCWALGQLGGKQAIPGLIVCLSDKRRYSYQSRRICDIAARALEEIGTPEALAALAEARVQGLLQ
jgi:hypothetical protein